MSLFEDNHPRSPLVLIDHTDRGRDTQPGTRVTAAADRHADPEDLE
jgi:hypothetical protein